MDKKIPIWVVRQLCSKFCKILTLCSSSLGARSKAPSESSSSSSSSSPSSAPRLGRSLSAGRNRSSSSSSSCSDGGLSEYLSENPSASSSSSWGGIGWAEESCTSWCSPLGGAAPDDEEGGAILRKQKMPRNCNVKFVINASPWQEVFHAVQLLLSSSVAASGGGGRCR